MDGQLLIRARKLNVFVSDLSNPPNWMAYLLLLKPLLRRFEGQNTQIKRFLYDTN